MSVCCHDSDVVGSEYCNELPPLRSVTDAAALIPWPPAIHLITGPPHDRVEAEPAGIVQVVVAAKASGNARSPETHAVRKRT